MYYVLTNSSWSVWYYFAFADTKERQDMCPLFTCSHTPTLYLACKKCCTTPTWICPHHQVHCLTPPTSLTYTSATLWSWFLSLQALVLQSNTMTPTAVGVASVMTLTSTPAPPLLWAWALIALRGKRTQGSHTNMQNLSVLTVFRAWSFKALPTQKPAGLPNRTQRCPLVHKPKRSSPAVPPTLAKQPWTPKLACLIGQRFRPCERRAKVT